MDSSLEGHTYRIRTKTPERIEFGARGLFAVASDFEVESKQAHCEVPATGTRHCRCEAHVHFDSTSFVK